MDSSESIAFSNISITAINNYITHELSQRIMGTTFPTQSQIK